MKGLPKKTPVESDSPSFLGLNFSPNRSGNLEEIVRWLQCLSGICQFKNKSDEANHFSWFLWDGVMVAKKINADWNRLQNNPDNWLDIPEFNVCPMDVGFRGFLQPIVGPTTKDTAFHSAVREVVSEVRGHASKRFKSMADFLRIDEEGLKRFESEIDSADIHIRSPVGDALFVYRYECIFAFLSAAVDAYSKNKNVCLGYLSFATLEVARMMTNAATDIDVLASLRSDIARDAVYKKLAADPKQKAKAQVRERWDEWKKDPLDRNGQRKYKSESAFARKMQDKYEDLESQIVIQGWCREWRILAITQPVE